ncbi:MAG TPA: cobalamin-binding protein [Gemmatimonadaceae bacterium]|nr:cobalamin-binding protein [Gemmatimonadaceae bacterium]
MRVVSLCPSLTELVFALGCGDQLVGRTRFCVHPAGAIDAVEKVGGTKNPRIERIVALAPDLVLMNEEENRVEDADALRSAGLHCHTSMPRGVADTAATVRSVGVTLGREDEAERIAREMEARHAQVRAATKGRPPVPFAYLIWRKPYMVAGGDTYVSALLSDAGGRNVFAGGERYPSVTADELGTADPSLLLLSSEPFPFSERNSEELAAETGIPVSHHRLVDGELLSWHGPRTAAGLEYAHDLLRGARR